MPTVGPLYFLYFFVLHLNYLFMYVYINIMRVPAAIQWLSLCSALTTSHSASIPLSLHFTYLFHLNCLKQMPSDPLESASAVGFLLQECFSKLLSHPACFALLVTHYISCLFLATTPTVRHRLCPLTNMLKNQLSSIFAGTAEYFLRSIFDILFFWRG